MASETSEYGWISKYEQEFDEREDDASLVLFAATPSAESPAGEGEVIPEAEFF